MFVKYVLINKLDKYCHVVIVIAKGVWMIGSKSKIKIHVLCVEHLCLSKK